MLKTKQKDKFYFIWAVLISASPILVSLLDLIGIDTNIKILAFIGFIVFCIIALIRYAILFKHDYTSTFLATKNFFTKTIKSPISILAIIALFFIFLSSIINGLNLETFVFLFYLIIFLCCYRIDKSKQRFIINLLIVTTAICCIMGFIDPVGEKMPGFMSIQINLSLQFYNPNHSAYVMATMLILSAGLLQNSNALIVELLYLSVSIIYIFFLFLNGSFAGITFAFICIVFIFLFHLLKYKRFPFKIFSLFITMICIGLLIEFVPNVNTYRTIPYNYFVEIIETINHYLKTDIPIPKLWGATKDYLTKGSLYNSYTFVDRQNLLIASGNAFTMNIKTILFGLGSGSYMEYSPHNMIMAMCLDYGIVVASCIMLIFILSIIKFFKNKNCHQNHFIVFAIICFILCGMTGSLDAHSGIYLFILSGLCLKVSKQTI